MLAGGTPEFRDHRRLVDQSGAVLGHLASIDLHHAITHHTLTEILVGAENPHLCHTSIGRRHGRRRAESVIGFVFLHGPHRHPHGPQRFFHDRNLGEDLGFHPLGGLVAVVEVVAKTFDHVIRGHTDVCRAISEQLERRIENSDRGRVG